MGQGGAGDQQHDHEREMAGIGWHDEVLPTAGGIDGRGRGHVAVEHMVGQTTIASLHGAHPNLVVRWIDDRQLLRPLCRSGTGIGDVRCKQGGSRIMPRSHPSHPWDRLARQTWLGACMMVPAQRIGFAAWRCLKRCELQVSKRAASGVVRDQPSSWPMREARPAVPHPVGTMTGMPIRLDERRCGRPDGWQECAIGFSSADVRRGGKMGLAHRPAPLPPIDGTIGMTMQRTSARIPMKAQAQRSHSVRGHRQAQRRAEAAIDRDRRPGMHSAVRGAAGFRTDTALGPHRCIGFRWPAEAHRALLPLQGLADLRIRREPRGQPPIDQGRTQDPNGF